MLVFYTTFNQNQQENLNVFMKLSFISVALDLIGFLIIGVEII